MRSEILNLKEVLIKEVSPLNKIATATLECTKLTVAFLESLKGDENKRNLDF